MKVYLVNVVMIEDTTKIEVADTNMINHIMCNKEIMEEMNKIRSQIMKLYNIIFVRIMVTLKHIFRMTK